MLAGEVSYVNIKLFELSFFLLWLLFSEKIGYTSEVICLLLFDARVWILELKKEKYLYDSLYIFELELEEEKYLCNSLCTFELSKLKKLKLRYLLFEGYFICFSSASDN